MHALLKKYKFTFYSFLIIIVCAIGLFLTSKNTPKTTSSNTPAPSLVPSVSPAPFNINDATTQIDQMGNTIDTSLSQMDSDITASQTNAAQDSAIGL